MSSSLASSLDGLRVLITRPTPQHQGICSAIEENGGAAFHFPMIEIAARDNAEQLQQVKTQIENLDNFHVLIFVSNNAVQYAANRIHDYWPQFPVGIDVIAIGPSTARMATTEFNCNVLHPAKGVSSEDVLAMPELENLEDKKIAIFRGEGGRELLAETLTERGAQVIYIEVYKRMPAKNSAEQLAQLIESADINVAAVTSGESLERLAALIDSTGEQVLSLKSQPLLVPSERVVKLAQNLGFSKLKVVLGAGVEATINTLQELAK